MSDASTIRTTRRQLEVLCVIRRQIEITGYPPTIRELGDHLGIKSTNGVNDHLKALEGKGLIERTSAKSRALTVTDLGHEITAEYFPEQRQSTGDIEKLVAHPAAALDTQHSVVEIPLLGKIAAGQPIDAIEHVEEMLAVDASFLGRHAPESCFALRVEGESMIEDGILDGDVIFIRKQQTAQRGQTVAVLIDGTATLKHYFKEQDHIRLEPANHTMAPIIVDHTNASEVAILGRLVGLYRHYQV